MKQKGIRLSEPESTVKQNFSRIFIFTAAAFQLFAKFHRKFTDFCEALAGSKTDIGCCPRRAHVAP
jgi:hypothetical protein